MKRLPLAVAALLGTLAAATACGGRAPSAAWAPAASSPPASALSTQLPVAALPSPPSPSTSSLAAPSPAALPAGVAAGVAVFDRRTGSFTEQRNTALRFRSASLVKLLIVLDYLWDRGPGYAIPDADRARLDVMLRSSDDAAATYFWKSRGNDQLVTRMVTRLGLKETGPPPADKPGYWGYTALSAADIVRIYRYLLDAAPAPVRDYVMGNLRQATRCGTDNYHQWFGIPTAFGRPWAVKQGWSGFGDRPASPCTANAAYAPAALAAPGVNAPGVNLAGEVLHTTGTVGSDDRTIVAVLTLHPDGTSFATASATLNRLTRSLRVPQY